MPLTWQNRVRAPFATELLLPPPFRAVALREAGDAFAHAQSIAAEAGAGTLVHVGRFDLAEFAVVLEPAEPLRTARRAIYAGLAALGDALASQAPPEKPIAFDWPAAIRIDGGLVGGGRLAWPAGANEDAPPPWLVFGAMVRTAAVGEEEPGLHPFAATLDGEGFDHDAGRLIESFARYLMAAVDAWQRDGFAAVAQRYLSRLSPGKHARYAIADSGDLLVFRSDGAAEVRRALVPALAVASWFDPATGGPRL